MNWFNYIGLIIVVLIMIPNIVYARKNKDSFSNVGVHKVWIILENIGRYASMFFMIFNIPFTWNGFYFSNGLLTYVIVNSILVFFYILLFIILWNKNNIIKSLLLSILPSLIFIFSGVVILSIPLIVFSIVFAISHVYISVKNTLLLIDKNE